MFTCRAEIKCMQDEEKAKKEHFGNAKGIKLLIRKLTWHKWDRTNCHSGCPILHVYEKEHFSKFLKTDVANKIMEM